MVKGGSIQAHSNTVKPFLTPENMESRLGFCKCHIDDDHEQFVDLMYIIYVDEKWFYLA